MTSANSRSGKTNPPQCLRLRLQVGVLACLLCAVLVPVALFAQGVSSDDSESRKTLLAQLSSSDEEQRLNAVTQLAVLVQPFTADADFDVVTALALAMRRDLSPVVRALATRALEFCGDPRAGEPLIAALASESELAVRKAIVYALARHASSQSAPQTIAAVIPLLTLLKDKKPEIRGVAAFALAEIRDPSTAPALLELLRKRGKDQDAFARAHAARALGAIGDRGALEALLKLLAKDNFPDVRREAAASLGRIAGKSDANVVEALRTAQLSADPSLATAADRSIAAIDSRPR